MTQLRMVFTKRIPGNIDISGGCLSDDSIYVVGSVESREGGRYTSWQYMGMLSLGGDIIKQLIGPEGHLYGCIIRKDDVIALGWHDVHEHEHFDIVRFDRRLKPMGRFRFKLVKEPFLVHGVSLASFGDDIIIIYLDEEDDLRVVKIGGDLRDFKVERIISIYDWAATGGSYYLIARMNPVTNNLWILEWHGDGAHIHHEVGDGEEELIYINKAHVFAIDDDLNVVMNRYFGMRVRVINDREWAAVDSDKWFVRNVDPDNPDIYFDNEGRGYIPVRVTRRRGRRYRKVPGYLILNEDGSVSIKTEDEGIIVHGNIRGAGIRDLVIKELLGNGSPNSSDYYVYTEILDIKNHNALAFSHLSYFQSVGNENKQINHVHLIKIED